MQRFQPSGPFMEEDWTNSSLILLSFILRYYTRSWICFVAYFEFYYAFTIFKYNLHGDLLMIRMKQQRL